VGHERASVLFGRRQYAEEFPMHFLVTGALDSPLGVVDLDARHLQTLQTFKSILKVFPFAKIHYVDAGVFSNQSSSALNGIRSRVSTVLDLRESNFVRERLQHLALQEHSNVIDSAAAKSLLESYSYHSFFSSMNFDDSNDVVLKLSARYQIRNGLSRTFRFWDESGLPYLAGKAHKSYIKPVDGEFPFYRRTVLWGIRTKYVDDFLDVNQRIMSLLGHKYSSGELFDLEHAFYKVLPLEKIFETRKLHVVGRAASFGRTVRI
jgi:hypothetical protein